MKVRETYNQYPKTLSLQDEFNFGGLLQAKNLLVGKNGPHGRLWVHHDLALAHE